jgi:hypothetical protein
MPTRTSLALTLVALCLPAAKARADASPIPLRDVAVRLRFDNLAEYPAYDFYL